MNPTIRWPDETLPVAIDFAPGVLTGLEMAARDGLLALPKIGLGVGGVLLGRRAAAGIQVFRTAPIACSYAKGPGFALTGDEMAVGLPKDADGNPVGASDGLEVVGWYCSKPGVETDMSEHDIELFAKLCPDTWQAMMLIRPSRLSATMASVGFRGTLQDGAVVWGIARELAWQELAGFQVSAVEQPAVKVAAAAAGVASGANSAQQVVAAVEETPTPAMEPERAAPEVPVDLPRSGMLFGAAEVKKSRRWIWWLGGVIAALAGLAGGAYVTQDAWMPRPPIAFEISVENAGSVTFHWNPAALQGVSQANLKIVDGEGLLHSVHLDAAQVRAGHYSFDTPPGKVTATITGDAVSATANAAARSADHLPESGSSK